MLILEESSLAITYSPVFVDTAHITTQTQIPDGVLATRSRLEPNRCGSSSSFVELYPSLISCLVQTGLLM